jgi:hypothetical protein
MLVADDPGERLRVGNVEQALELGKFVVAHCWQVRICEATHYQIHLAYAAPPGAKQNPPPALIERSASEGGAGHQAPFLLPGHAVLIRRQEESFLANRLIQPRKSAEPRARPRLYRQERVLSAHGIATG